MATTTQTVANDEALWRHLGGIIDRPVATFEAVVTRRGWSIWAVPLLVVLLGFIIVTVVQLPYTVEVARQQAESQLAALPAQQAEAARETMEFTLSTPFMLATGLGVGIIVLLGGVVIQAAFFYFGALMAGGADASYGSMFNLSAWARLPIAIGYLVQTGIIMATQSMLNPGFSYLVASGNIMEDVKNPLYALLANLDLFWLWHLGLAVVGLAVVSRMSRGKSLVLVLIYAVIVLGAMVGMMVGPSMLFGI